jgi:peroxiredoxin
MAFTESNMLALGTRAPYFSLPDTVSDKKVSWDEVRGEAGTLVMFICNHCPYVIHTLPELIRVALDYRPKGIGVVAISSNDAEKYPQDGPERMREEALLHGYPFPYLYDESQEVARAYAAACTPDLYLFDAAGQLYYRGRLDESRPKNEVPLSGTDLRGAIDGLLAGRPAPDKQYPSAGCNIKWKSA